MQGCLQFEDGTIASIIKVEDNPSAFLFRPGGWYVGEKFQEKLLLGGDIGIYRGDSPEVENLCKDFSRSLTNKFKFVGRSVDNIKWKVGPEAFEALLNNVRLVTEVADFTKKWDLTIQSTS